MDQVSVVPSNVVAEVDPTATSALRNSAPDPRGAPFSSVLGDARQATQVSSVDTTDPVNHDLNKQVVLPVRAAVESGKLLPGHGKTLPPGLTKGEGLDSSKTLEKTVSHPIGALELGQVQQARSVVTDVATVESPAAEEGSLVVDDGVIAPQVSEFDRVLVEEALPELASPVLVKSAQIEEPAIGVDFPVYEKALSKGLVGGLSENTGPAVGTKESTRQQPDLLLQDRTLNPSAKFISNNAVKGIHVTAEQVPGLESTDLQQLVQQSNGKPASIQGVASQQEVAPGMVQSGMVNRGTGFGEALAAEFRQAPLAEFSAPVDAEGWGEEFSTKVRWLINNDLQSASLKLKPAELGSMNIRIILEGDQARLHIMVQQASAREAIENAMPRLREFMEQGGLTLTHSDVEQQDQRGDQALSEEGKVGWNGFHEDNSDEVKGGGGVLPGKVITANLVDYYI